MSGDTPIALPSSNRRLLAPDDGKVRSPWKDYRHDDLHGKMAMTADEFIRRLLIHCTADGFQRIRYYGFLCNRPRERKLVPCRELLGLPWIGPAAAHCRPTLTGISLAPCPACNQGRILVIEVFPPMRHRRCVCDKS